MGHLRAWQTRSIARLEGAQRKREPEFPPWPAELHPDTEDNPDAVNAWNAGGRIDAPSGLGSSARLIAVRSSTGRSCERNS